LTESNLIVASLWRQRIKQALKEGYARGLLADGQASTGRSPSTLAEFVRHAVADALPDIIAGRLAVVFCGINPGMTAAAVGHHFAGRGNRFWRVIHLAGFTPEEILPENDRTILRHRCGLTATWLLMLLI
jgi:mismatch-specific thymine-DNA glycosylase